jgi:hypothetical protein
MVFGGTMDGYQTRCATWDEAFGMPRSRASMLCGHEKSAPGRSAAEKHMPQVQHNMWVTNATAAVLSIITGGAKWLEIKISADAVYQHLLLTAEKKFWRCVESGERWAWWPSKPADPRWRQLGRFS